MLKRAGFVLVATVSLMVAGLVGSSPSGAAGVSYTAQTLTGNGTLGGISCPSVGNCVSVGEVAGSPNGGVIETLAGGTWTPTTLNAQGLNSPNLNGVWCASLTSCIAVGDYGTSPTGANALIETLSGTTWTDLTPSLSSLGAVASDLTSISCLSITSCVAVGSYGDSGGNGHALFESLSGGTWTPATATDPSGSTVVNIDSVQCFSTTSCLAVGEWGPNDTTFNGLLETLSGTTWTASTLPGNYLRSLWCGSSTSCIAVGYGNSTTDAGVTETLSGTTWTSGTLPGVGDGGTSNGIVGVSCTPDITSCVAIGGWRPPAPNSSEPFTLIETLSGGTWTPTDLGASNGYVFPEGIACPAITACVGVGSSEATNSPAVIMGAPVVAPPPPPPHGYWLVGSDGGIFTFGSAQFYGSTGSLKLNRPVVGITPTSSKTGYWLVASDGGIFAFGDAPYVGSIPGLGLAPAGTVGGKHLNAPVVGMVPSTSGAGYFMLASDGGVFTFGDAQFEGSCPGIGGCSGAGVGVAPDASGHGYWLVTATGRVYTFGDAPYFGAPGTQSSPITSIVRTPDGGGYWVLDANGSVFGYGDALYYGAVPAGAAGGVDPASAIFTTSDGGGYWITTALGKVYAFGDAPNDGDMSATHLNGVIIAATGF